MSARGRTAPEAAICEGWTEGVRYFIGSPMVGKARLDDLLHFACSRYIPSAEIISLLLQHGANPNSRDHLKRTPLHNLILHSNRGLNLRPEALQALLQQPGLQIDAKDAAGNAPSHYASSRSVLQALADHGAQISAARLATPCAVM